MFRQKQKIFLSFFFSLFILLTISCSSSAPPLAGDDTPPAAITLYGSWVSGEVLYHPNTSTDPQDETLFCDENGLSLSVFTDIIIEENISLKAWHMANLVCEEGGFEVFGYDTEEECILDFQEQNILDYQADLSENDIADYQNKISYNYNYDEMELLIQPPLSNQNQEQGTYIVSFDGQCLNSESISQNACGLLSDSDVIWNGSECVFLTKLSCEEIGEGTWYDGFTDFWYGDPLSNLYQLDNFFNVIDNNLALVFDPTTEAVSISVDSNTDTQCICNDTDGDEIPNIDESLNAEDCVLSLNDCIWLNKHCVTLNFSR